MAGAGTKLWATADTVTATEFQTYLQDQIVGVFDDTSARDAAWGGAGEPTLAEGAVAYIKDVNQLHAYASAWVPLLDLDTWAADASGNYTIKGTVTVGVDGTGHDVKFFGATSGAYMLWDEDVDDLILAGDARLGVGITATGTARLSVHGGLRFTYAASAADIYTGIGATGTDVLTLCTAGSEVLKISSAGRVGIGIGPTGTAKLALNGGLRFTAAVGAGDIYTGLGAVGTDIVALCTAGTEKVRVTSAGLVGIGTDGPDSKLHVWGSTAGAVTAHADAQVTIEAALTSGLQFLSGSGQENRIIFGDRYDNDIGGITYDHDDNSLRFTLNTAERIVVDSGGTVFLDGSLAMNGDTAAANQLDTYEEGNWTPGYVSSNGDMSGVTVNASFTRGTYVRIGRQVWVNGFIRTDSITTLGTGYAIITGLPYDSYNVAGYNAYPTHVRTYFAFNADGPDIVTLGNNDNELWLARDGGAGTTDHGILATDLSTAANRNGIAFQLTYITDAAA